MSDFFRKLFYPLTATLDFIQKYFKALIFLLVLLILLAPASTESVKPPNLATVELTGPITDARKTLQAIEEAAKDDDIKGVLFFVDSPGGAVAPSVEISLAVRRLAEKKPVVAYAAGTMASGSYYAAIHATKIVANPAATIGSIGVIMEGINIRPLMNKIGVEPQVVKAGRYKEAGTPFRKWTPQEREEIEKHVLDIYHMFVRDVAKARHLDPTRPETFADAKIFIAEKAQRVGLIDETGSLEKAKEVTKTLAGVKEARWKEKSKWERYLEELAEKSAKVFASQLRGWVVR
jgi:protease-4